MVLAGGTFSLLLKRVICIIYRRYFITLALKDPGPNREHATTEPYNDTRYVFFVIHMLNDLSSFRHGGIVGWFTRRKKGPSARGVEVRSVFCCLNQHYPTTAIQFDRSGKLKRTMAGALFSYGEFAVEISGPASVADQMSGVASSSTPLRISSYSCIISIYVVCDQFLVI